jgi:hypothetical protein
MEGVVFFICRTLIQVSKYGVVETKGDLILVVWWVVQNRQLRDGFIFFGVSI